jgi:hypothetical protein
MKNLDEIPKNDLFKVPDGYFESLPGKIQNRISLEQPLPGQSIFLRYKLQFVAPALILILACIVWLQYRQTPLEPELMLADVDTEQLMAYLGESEMSTEELFEGIEAIDLENLEDELYLPESDQEDIDSVFSDFDDEND